MTAPRLCIAIVIAQLAVPLAATASAAETASAPSDTGEQARVAFHRGVELYEARDFGGAGVEFRRAYQLAKSFRILYNLGRVAVEEHDYAAALDLFMRYLADGGDQISAERAREVREELSSLANRIAKLQVDYDEAGATIFVDDVEKGQTPLTSPIVVNLGRRHLELRPRNGLPIVRWVEAPGGELVRVHLTKAGASLELSDFISSPQPEPRQPSQDGHHALWVPWTATAVCAAGAIVAGTIAYRASGDLSGLRQSYPASKANLDDKQRTVRIASAVSDGFTAGTLALAALSLYLTLDGPKASPSKPQTSVAWAWPGVMVVEGHF